MSITAEFESLLRHGSLPPAKFHASAIRCESVRITMRDGVHLATDVYLPPDLPAPVLAMRTPYGRDSEDFGYASALLAFARRGYVVVAQDCRGTGDSEPDSWDYYMYESQDSVDLIDWIVRQPWGDGFIGALGGSYVGQTQWCMATNPSMSAISPSNSGLGFAVNTARLYMFLNAYARTIGKGENRLNVPSTEMERAIEPETLAGGYFNEPLYPSFPEALHAAYPGLREMHPARARRWLWEQYCAMNSVERADLIKLALGVRQITSVDVEALPSLFGHRISHDAHTLPHVSQADLCRRIHAPALLRTGWYDWGLNDVLATWQRFRREAHAQVASRTRLIVGPYAHNTAGYREGAAEHPELARVPNVMDQVGLLMRWNAAVRERTTDSWPTVMYYLMGANEWHEAHDWPVPEAKPVSLYLGESGTLTRQSPPRSSQPFRYRYDPNDPTPTVGGSIVSYRYTPGSVDVSEVQKRADVAVFSTAPLDADVDVVGPLRMILYASASTVDADLVARLSDVFPDGRAIQLQNGVLRARYRDLDGEPQLLEPGCIYRFEIDMWATANRFRKGHRLRVDVSSSDFPRFDRNSNRGGGPGEPVPTGLTLYRDAEQPSHIIVPVLRGSLP